MSIMTDLTHEIQSDSETFGYAGQDFMFKTCFPNFDYLNGQTINDSHGKPVFSVGICAGKSIMLVGGAGSGKSTAAIQMAASVMKKYQSSTMFIYDFEDSNTKDRIRSITGMSSEYYDEHVTLKQVKIYTETVLKLVKKIAAFKSEHRDELMVDNAEGVYDENGKLVKIMPPTFVIIDSIAGMKTESYQEGDEMNGLTAGGRTAIINKELFVRIAQPCLDTDIIVIAINHETANMSMGVTPPVSQTRYLKNTVAIGGGSGIKYFCNLFVEITPKDKLEDNGLSAKGDKFGGVKGFEAAVEIIKSRTSTAGVSTTLVFNQREGFDPILSMLVYLDKVGAAKGQGIGRYLDGLETIKFRNSTFKTTYLTNPQFKDYCDKLYLKKLEESVKISSKLLPSATPESENINSDETSATDNTKEDTTSTQQ